MITAQDAKTLAKALQNTGKAMAQDADKGDKSGGSWFTMNGTHVHCPEGVSKADAGRLFAAKKQAQRWSKKEKQKQADREWHARMERESQQKERELRDTIDKVRKNDPVKFLGLIAQFDPERFAKIKKRLGVDAVPSQDGVLRALQAAYELGLRHGLENALVSINNMNLETQGENANLLYEVQTHIEKDRAEIVEVCVNDFPGLYQRAVNAPAGASAQVA